MKPSKLTFLLTAISIVATWSGQAKAADPTEFSICHHAKNKSDCISFKKGCPSGVTHTVDSKQVPCPAVDKSACPTLERFFEDAAIKFKALPESQRTDKPCDGYTLVLPGQKLASCQASQARGSKMLGDLLEMMANLCDPE